MYNKYLKLLLCCINSISWLSAAQIQLLDALQLAELLQQQRPRVNYHRHNINWMRPVQNLIPIHQQLNPEQLAHNWFNAHQQRIIPNVQEELRHINIAQQNALQELLLDQHDNINQLAIRFHLPVPDPRAARQELQRLINNLITNEFDAAFARHLAAQNDQPDDQPVIAHQPPFHIDHLQHLQQPPAPPKQQDTVEGNCLVCLDNDIPLVRLHCGHHAACTSCLVAAIRMTLRDGDPHHLKCSDRACQEELNNEDINKIVRLSQALPPEEQLPQNTLQQLQRKLFFAARLAQQGAHHCPHTNCDYVHDAQDIRNNRHLVCDQGHEMCTQCFAEHPAGPCPPAIIAADAARDIQANEEWIQQHTKPCPQCGARIERNEGCNGVVCQQCHHEFCWLCLKDLGVNALHANWGLDGHHCPLFGDLVAQPAMHW